MLYRARSSKGDASHYVRSIRFRRFPAPRILAQRTLAPRNLAPRNLAPRRTRPGVPPTRLGERMARAGGMTSGQRFALGSMIAGCLVLSLKSAAWWVTGSSALYSDALESIVNVAASLIAWMALRFAARPADANHPYGHDKAEFFAAVIEGVLIIVAALLIFAEAWDGWRHVRPLDAPLQGIGLNTLATVINGAWSVVLLRAGRRLRSPALQADARHLMADVVTSVGIAAGVFLAVLTGQYLLDPLLAAATGVYVLWSGMRMISISVSGLMDEAPEAAVVTRIKELVANSAAGAIEAHDLRTRHAGRLTFLEFHLVVPGSMTVAAAHAICDRIEDTLRAEMGHLMITIHVEPEEKAKQGGVPVL
jgi:cation diffusion facilitator family transporter